MIFAKKKLDLDIPEIVSEEIAKRDSFFHSCWMLLKQDRRDLWDEMTKVELSMSGYVEKEIEKKEPDNDPFTIL